MVYREKHFSLIYPFLILNQSLKERLIMSYAVRILPMGNQTEVIHFSLEGDLVERFFKALRKENLKDDSPQTKNPFAKVLLTEALERRGF